MSNRSTEALFDALGVPTRRRILELLGDGDKSVAELSEDLPISRPAVSKHLKVLGGCGAVVHRSVGTRNLYALAPAAYVPAQQWLVDTWDHVLGAYADAVRAHVAGPGRQAE